MIVLFQFWLCWHSFGYFTWRPMITPHTCGSLSKIEIWKDAIGIECNTKKKVLCSAEKISVIWAERNSRSSVGHYGMVLSFIKMIVVYPIFFYGTYIHKYFRNANKFPVYFTLSFLYIFSQFSNIKSLENIFFVHS